MRCTIVLEFDNGDGSVVKRVDRARYSPIATCSNVGVQFDNSQWRTAMLTHQVDE